MARVEAELGITLPAAFRRLMTEQGYLLRGLTQNLDGVDVPFLQGVTVFTPDEFIRHNLWERGRTGLRRTHGRWWRKYVLIENLVGGMTSYALPLRGEPRVVVLFDSTTEPLDAGQDFDEFVRDLLESYVPVKISDHEAAKAREKEAEAAVAAGEKPFLAHIIDDPADDLRRLVFADWLEENGEGPRAEFIRARIALDGKRPAFGEYADAVEKLRECQYQPPRIEVPPGFVFFAHDSHLEQWWSDSGDTLERGLPSFADVDSYSDFGETARRIVENLPVLFATTPIRGLKMDHRLNEHAEAIFAAPGAAGLTRLAFDSRPPGSEVCPVVVALAASPVAANLTRLEVNNGLANPATVAALVDAPFTRLVRFDIKEADGPADGYRQFAASPWLLRLERLTSPAPPGAFGPTSMPRLHTLGVWIPGDGWLKEMGRNADLPALRRLFIHGANLRGQVAAALAGLRCGELVELWLRNSAYGPKSLAALLAAPWARRLEVLTLEVEEIDPALESAVKASPCAETLRILTIK